MTQRERDILKASVSWTDKTLTVNEEKAFQAGAKWADEHPKSEMLKRSSMIDKLHEYSIGDQNTCYGHRAPSNWELMEKINELVEEVNRLKEKFGEE